MSLSDDMQANVNSTSRYYDFVLNIQIYIVCIFRQYDTSNIPFRASTL